MNIKEAKQEIIDTIEAYHRRDSTGAYEISPEKQRPLLLIGPPGIGKTAIMEQVAEELGISLVSYTITHHTRQSAIGLPYIVHRTYGGRDTAVTEYTMSEIVASVYDQIERSGINEGILFLDEINCVSETLAPTMLQFLQYKMFGTHRVPEGYVIVTAGNPPEYNKSVRDFDIVTLDRVRRLDIEADFDVWKEYAYRAGVHGSILGYLGARKDRFYTVKQDLDGKRFVTARSWEDLSRVITVYEEMKKPVTERLVGQYLQDPETAQDFALYYALYQKYRTTYRVPDILSGICKKGPDSLPHAPFDEKLSLLSLLIDSLNGEFRAWAENEDVEREVFSALKAVLAEAKEDPAASVSEILDARYQAYSRMLEKKREAGVTGKAVLRQGQLAKKALGELREAVASGKPGSTVQHDNASQMEIVRTWFNTREQNRRAREQEAGAHLANCFSFLAETFGEGQEMVLFLTELTASYDTLRYVKECGSESWYKWNKLLLLRDRRETLRQEAMELLEVQQDDGKASGEEKRPETDTHSEL